jgi:hypothetical protein
MSHLCHRDPLTPPPESAELTEPAEPTEPIEPIEPRRGIR